MISKILVASVLFVLANCEPPTAQYGAPFSNNNNNNNNGGYSNGGYDNGAVGNNYGAPNYDNNGNNGHNADHGDHNDHGYGEPKAYEFGYQVKDDYTGTNYNRQEQSDGNQVTGSYRVALPDGRTQIVTYYADWKTGFHADVRYEGEAQYPDQYNKGNNGNGYANAGYPNAGYANNNGYNQAPSNQYGAPVNPVAVNNHYSTPSNNNYNSGYDSGNNYDSYANSGYANKPQPNTNYGAP